MNARYATKPIAGHPAFLIEDGLLHCPCCGWRTDQSAEFTSHFLRHQPAAVLAAHWLPAIEFMLHMSEQDWEMEEVLDSV